MARYVLGLETGIDGGSVSILDGGVLIDSVEGSGDISKSEDLLSMLDGLLRKHGLEKKGLGQIVISDEPGSLTGIRIGLATAKGLSDALDVPVWKISILEALAKSAGSAGRVLSAIVDRKNTIYFREYFMDDEREVSPLSESIGKTTPVEFAARMESSGREPVSIRFALSEGLSRTMGLEGESAGLLKGRGLFVVKGSPSEIIGRCFAV